MTSSQAVYAPNGCGDRVHTGQRVQLDNRFGNLSLVPLRSVPDSASQEDAIGVTRECSPVSRTRRSDQPAEPLPRILGICECMPRG
jgi:hypothetical protein